jgi:hypothetical protein
MESIFATYCNELNEENITNVLEIHTYFNFINDSEL